MSKAPSREEALFADALAQPPANRGSYLAKACGADVDLLAHLVALVAAHEGPASVMTLSPVARPASLLEEKPGDRIGRYKVLQQIGEGGCGVVWMAEQEEPVRRRVALKVIKLGMDTKAVVARFEAERQALAMMDHPNIAKVHDAGATETGRPFFVMELVRGIPITKYCDENQLTPTARLELFIKVCQAIQHAHQKGIIHRDIKPSNILVTVNDGQPTPKVIDFGIAKATQGRLTDATVFTAFEQFIGTPVYMSPEQAEISSVDIDTRSDIYSLGVLLYELLTGRPPFDPKAFAAAGVDGIRQQIREVEPPRPSARLSTLDADERATIAKLRNTASAELSLILRGDLDWIVMRCIEKDRIRRYDTANGLAMDIQRYLRNEPVVARPPSTGYLLQKLIRRHRLGFAATLAITATVVTGAIVSTWLAVRATRAELTAETARDAEARLRQVAETQETIARQRAYAADMQLVQQALDGDNLYRARELLYRQKPLAGQPDLRGWEWRYLWQLCQPDYVGELLQTNGNLRSVSLSGDGRLLAVAASGHYLSVLNVTTREKIALPDGLGRDHVALAPRGQLLATYASHPGSGSEQPRHRIVLWNIETRKVMRELPLGAGCAGLFFSEDAQRVVASTYPPDNTITVWRVTDGAVLQKIEAPRGQSFEGTSFAVTTDLSLGAHGTPGTELRVVGLKSGQELWRREGAEKGQQVMSVAFSADGKLLASGTGFVGSAISLWDAASGKLIRRLEGHHGSIFSLLFWPDGKTLASASGDRTVRIWDVASGRLLNTLRGHRLEAWRLALLPDNATVISGGKDGGVYLWNAFSRRDDGARTQLPDPVAMWRFAEDGKSMLTVGVDGQVLRWHGKGLKEKTVALELGAIAADFSLGLQPEAFSPNLQFIAFLRAGAGREVEVWDIPNRSLRHKFTAARGMTTVAIFRDRHTLWFFDERDAETVRCREWDLSSGTEIRSWRMPVTSSSALTATFTSDGQRCILSNAIGKSTVHDLRTGKNEIVDVPAASRFPQFSPDGKLLAVSMMGNHTAIIRETSAYRPVATLSAMIRVPHSVAFYPDGARLAVGSGQREGVVLWSMESHEPVLTLEANGAVFLRTAFSPDGAYLGSRSTLLPTNHGILHLWRAPSWEEIAQVEKAQEGSAKKP